MNLTALFCNHAYEKVAWKECQQNNIRFSMRLYKCTKCGKEIWVDGRKDFIERGATRCD